MSENIIKGFPADGGIAKYDFGALANVPEPLKKMPTAKVGDFLKVSAVDDSGEVVAVEAVGIPDGTQGNYTLPVANAETLGGVRPVTKTDTMTQPVGVDGTGALFTAPGESEGVTDEQVASAVSDYLDAHPEATTTVQDGSIERVKLSDKLARSLELTGGDIFGNTEQAEGASSFAEVFQTVKNEVMAEYAGDINKIPLIIHTDSHGTLDRSVFSTINELVNWLDVSKVVNLGDVVYKNWDSSNMQTNTQLQDMLDAVQDIPLHKRLDVYGNHDTWMTPSNGAYVKTDDQAFLQQYFRNVDARRYSNNGWFTVRDDYRNIKYVVLSPYEATTGNYASTAQIRFLINELGADDGYDIILVCHETLNPDWDNRVIPTTTDLTGSTVNSSLFWCGKNTNVIFSARQKRTSGTFTDSDGVVHEFDFSGCKTDVLCALHGHTHYDVYSYIDDALVCSSFSAFTCDERWVHFVLVDRANRELKVWKISTTDFTYATYTVPFDVPESAAKYRITRKLLNCTAYTVSNFVREGQPYAQRIVANSGYTLGDIIVEMGGEDVTESALSDDGYILIPSVSGDVKVTAVDDASDIATPFYVVTNNYSANIGDSGHARKDSSQTIVSIVIGEGQSYKVQSINAADYHTYDLKVEMGGEDVTDSVTTYSRSFAIVEIDPVTDDVFITANAVPLGFTPVTIDENGVESESDSQYSSDYIDVSSYRSIVISPSSLGNFAVALYDGDKRFKTLLTGINGSTVVYISDDTKYVRFTNHSSLQLKVNDAHSENESFDVTITKPAGITIDNDISTVQAGGSVKVQAANTYEDTTMVVTAKCGTSTLSGVFDAETGNINVPYVNGVLSIDISAKLNLTFPGDTTWVYSEKFYLADDTVLRAMMYARQTVICYSEDGTKLGNCTIPNTGIFTLLEGTSYIVVNATLENVNAGNIELYITG